MTESKDIVIESVHVTAIHHTEVTMERNHTKSQAVCRLCGKSEPQMLPAVLVRAKISREIRKRHPDWKPEGYICQADLARIRSEYIQDLIEAEKEELTSCRWNARRTRH